MLRAIIFDFGGVILRTVDRSHRRAWDKRLNLAPGTVEELFFNSPAGQRAQRGAVSEAEQWRIVGGDLKLSDAELTQLQEDFWAGDALNDEVVGVIQALRPRYRVGLLSNAMSGLRRSLAEDYQLDSHFDAIIISAEIGVMKPDPRIYRHALRALGCEPGEALFVDDLPANVTGAREAGLNALHFTPQTHLRQALQSFGVLLEDRV